MSGPPGIVYLVGAGPGDPGLMTLRSLELIVAADVILHDRLIPAAALEGARPEAELLYVGKQPGDASVPQEEIAELLIDRARQGKLVVRLKGGDPFVFGRGGEEAEALTEAGIPFEVVPGITAGVAAPAYAGIPVTHRDDASAVAFVTGHLDPKREGSDGIDFEGLARFPGTLVFYMGVKALPEISEGLIAAGRDASEPAAVIERGTLPAQRTVAAPLGELPAAAAEAGIKPPAITLVGSVAARREAIAWFERRPLHGTSVVVTRARPQASELSRRLAALGADPVELPAIRIEPRTGTPEVREAAEGIVGYDLVCLTSVNAAALLFEAMADAGRDARSLAGATVAAIGPGTATALAKVGIVPDVVPERSVAESLVEALEGTDVKGKRALVARAAEAREVLPDALRERGAELDVITLYETIPAEPDPDALERAAEADYITFTSASTVRNLVAALDGKLPPEARIASIGPVTSEAAREAGLEVHVEAERHDLDGLVEALLVDASSRAAPG
jgi:uroporphyrinogen III methyltransferase / synthase